MSHHTSEYRIHTYTAAEAGQRVNSYLVETTDGVVLIDANLLLSDIRALAFHGIHPYTADGHTGSWLAALDTHTAALGSAALYPDHGTPGIIGIRAARRRYLMMCREMVGRLVAGAPTPTDGQREQLIAMTIQYLPGAPLTWMISLGADPVAAELAGKVTGGAGTASTEAVTA